MNAPAPTLLRIDVAGVSVFVRGESAYRHLEQINRQLGIAKMALHRIRTGHGESVEVAAKALEDMKK